MYSVILKDSFTKEQKSYIFYLRSISDNGIIRAIKQHKEEINKLFSYVVNATITATEEETGKQIYKGFYKYDCFSGHGEIEIKHIKQL